MFWFWKLIKLEYSIARTVITGQNNLNYNECFFVLHITSDIDLTSTFQIKVWDHLCLVLLLYFTSINKFINIVTII